MLIDERWDTLVEADNGCETSVAVVQCAKVEEGKRGKCRDLDKCKTKKSDKVNGHFHILNRNVKYVFFFEVNVLCANTTQSGIFHLNNQSYGSKKNQFRRLWVY